MFLLRVAGELWCSNVQILRCSVFYWRCFCCCCCCCCSHVPPAGGRRVVMFRCSNLEMFIFLLALFLSLLLLFTCSSCGWLASCDFQILRSSVFLLALLLLLLLWLFTCSSCGWPESCGESQRPRCGSVACEACRTCHRC